MAKNFELQTLTPNLAVKDVNETVKYYKDRLGFELVMSVPESGTLNWAMIQREEVSIMLQTFESLKEDLPTLGITSSANIGTFFIKMKGIENLYNEIKNKVDIAADMRTSFYGMKEFTIRDLNGFYLTFAEEVQ